jgi:hypothetical protein
MVRVLSRCYGLSGCSLSKRRWDGMSSRWGERMRLLLYHLDPRRRRRRRRRQPTNTCSSSTFPGNNNVIIERRQIHHQSLRIDRIQLIPRQPSSFPHPLQRPEDHMQRRVGRFTNPGVASRLAGSSRSRGKCKLKPMGGSRWNPTLSL